MANQYGNLGRVYQTRGKLGKAIEFYKKSLALFKEIDAKKITRKSNPYWMKHKHQIQLHRSLFPPPFYPPPYTYYFSKSNPPNLLSISTSLFFYPHPPPLISTAPLPLPHAHKKFYPGREKTRLHMWCVFTQNFGNLRSQYSELKTEVNGGLYSMFSVRYT